MIPTLCDGVETHVVGRPPVRYTLYSQVGPVMDIHKVHAFIARRFRPARLARFRAAFPFSHYRTIIDFGGGSQNWEMMDNSYQVTLLNLDPAIPAGRYPLMVADARNTGLAESSFDVAFSNSVIEHLPTWEDQKQFAREMSRVGKTVYCQTPNFWFPVEPHLLTPFVHWIPGFTKNYWLMRYCTVTGWLMKPTREFFDQEFSTIRLLSSAEFRTLFPDCEIWTERVLGLAKSFTAVSKQSLLQPSR
jgi:hypothetical protein